MSELATRAAAAPSLIHREVGRVERVGLATSRRVGRTRLVRADATSPYFAGLREVLVRAFGPPRVLSDTLRGTEGVARAVVFGSWARRYHGVDGDRPVGDIDVLVLGAPDRDELFARIRPAEDRLGRPVQITIRPADWWRDGEGAFHDEVVGGSVVELVLEGDPDALDSPR